MLRLVVLIAVVLRKKACTEHFASNANGITFK